MLNMLSKVDKEGGDLNHTLNHDEKDALVLQTHTYVYEKYSGKVDKIRDNFAEVHLDIIENMSADNNGLIHNGFIFSSASLAAAAAVNEKNGFVIGSINHFLTPVREGDTVIFKAKSRHKIGRKRVVDVIGRVEDVKVFIGEFTVALMDKHVLSVKLDDIDISEYEEDEDL